VRVPSDSGASVRWLVTVLLVVLPFAALAAAGLLWLVRVLRAELRALRVESSAQLAERTGEVDRRLNGLAETFDRRLGALDGRLLASQRSSGETATQIAEKLGKLDGTAAQMLARANDLARLEQALRPPKARGGFGELLLENLLRDRLPASAYSIQHTFSSGDRVDAVVRAGQLVAVDSKFPLDNYNRIVEAEGDDARKLHEKAFARDVRTHIDAIASKYIRPEDGTYDFAFMYVPVEAVYYELACGSTGALLQYAHAKRVFAVSPSTFVAYLQVIVLGLRGMQIEEHAHEVMSYVAELGKDFTRFKEDFDLVGTHLGRAQSKFSEADRRLDRFEGKLERARSEDARLESGPLAEPAAPPRAIEAA
jgi:DNA recombination protein RmuC